MNIVHLDQSGTPPFVHLVVEPAFGRFLLVAELADKSVQDLPDGQREVAAVLVNERHGETIRLSGLEFDYQLELGRLMSDRIDGTATADRVAAWVRE